MLKNLLLLSAICLVFTGCGDDEETSTTPSDSIAQQLGDAMTSMDDSGGSDGGYAMILSGQKAVAAIEPKNTFLEVYESLVPPAYAATCAATNTFGTCSSSQVIRDFQDCTIGRATFQGTITFDFSDASCTLANNSDTITRNPSFTITGANGGTFQVSRTGTNGQRITRNSASSFAYSNDGIRRVLSFNSRTIADYTAQTTSDITITGASRSGRTANGGSLQVTNNLTETICNFVPTNVTWSNTCTCAVSGTWSATCDDGTTATYVIGNGCGQGTLTIDNESSEVTLDQCSSI